MPIPVKTFSILAMVFLMAGLSGCMRSVPATIEFHGLERSYRIFVPSSYDPAAPASLVFALHGGNGDAQRIERYTDFNSLAEAEGFIVVYPEGFEGNWNDGRVNGPGADAGTDDVGFLTALLDKLEAEYTIDPGRVFITGASNGGIMSLRMACDRADRFAAAAPVIASMPATYTDACMPSQPVAILFINGVDDELMPYEGGPVSPQFGDRGEVIAVEDSAALWAERNGCLGAEVVHWPDMVPDDGTEVVDMTYSGCETGGAVRLLAIEGGGHTWPGGTTYQPERALGTVSEELDATATIWEFFKRHARP